MSWRTPLRQRRSLYGRRAFARSPCGAPASAASDDAISLVMGAQLETLLAGEPGIDAGPAAGPSEQALLALAEDPTAGEGDRPPLAALIEESRSASPEAVRALVFALPLAM